MISPKKYQSLRTAADGFEISRRSKRCGRDQTAFQRRHFWHSARDVDILDSLFGIDTIGS